MDLWRVRYCRLYLETGEVPVLHLYWQVISSQVWEQMKIWVKEECILI